MRSLLTLAMVVVASVALTPKLLALDLGPATDVSFTATYDGSTQRYVRFLPADFNPAQQYDLMIALHGHGSDRWQYATATRDECRAIRDAAANNNMIMICPDYRATTSWMSPVAEADMVQIIQDLKSQYNIGKTIVTGASMGGAGTLSLTALHPDLVDGACSLNGLANFVGYQSSYPSILPAIEAAFGGTYAAVPEVWESRSASNAPGSFTMPLSIAAGGQDTIVPPQSVLQLADTVKNTNPQNPKTAVFHRPDGPHSTNYVDTAVALEYVIQNAKGIDTDLHPITINTSFEYQTLSPGSSTSTVDGWTTVGSSLSAARLTAATYDALLDDPMPDGDQMAIANNASIYQYLGTTVRAGTYHLSLSVAIPKGTATVGTFQAGFMTADSTVASSVDLAWADADSSTTDPGLVQGKWTDVGLDWIVEPDNPAIGKHLYLDLAAMGANAVFFDAASVSYSAVPEPATLAQIFGIGLFGLLASAWRRRSHA
ncbi:MAG: alpha/beta fold hydrolase [Pirellulales bacterium]|nr:alpha/beta fold hydrolase [Pirellulales bacterium]